MLSRSETALFGILFPARWETYRSTAASNRRSSIIPFVKLATIAPAVSRSALFFDFGLLFVRGHLRRLRRLQDRAGHLHRHLLFRDAHPFFELVVRRDGWRGRVLLLALGERRLERLLRL